MRWCADWGISGGNFLTMSARGRILAARWFWRPLSCHSKAHMQLVWWFGQRALAAARGCASRTGVTAVPESVLEAIKQGIWDYEPPQIGRGQFRSTQAIPGS